MRLPNPLPLLLLAALLSPLPGQAQGAEVRHDQRELGRDQAEVADDVRDLRWAETLRARFDEAWRRADWRRLQRLEDGVLRYLAQERRDARADLAHDAGEASRDAAGLQQERREGDRHEAREEAGRLHRDRREAQRDQAVLHRLEDLERRFAGLRGLTDRGAMERKRAIIDDLVRMARNELRHDERGRREDRRELREDLRDTRR